MENTLTQAVTNSLIPALQADAVREMIQQAPEALELNSQSSSKALAYGRDILARIKENGMSPELDQELNDYQVKLKTTLQTMEARRKPLTKFLDDIGTQFTSMENQIAPRKTGSIYEEVQKIRNEYAAFLAEERRKAEADLRRKQALDQERINLKAEAANIIRIQFGSRLKKALQDLLDAFNAPSSAEFSRATDLIIASEEWSLDPLFLDSFPIQVTARMVPAEELPAIIESAKREHPWENLNAEFQEAVRASRASLMDQIPGRLKFLENQEAAAELQRKAAAEAAAAKSEEEKQAAAQRAEALKKQQEEALALEAQRRKEQEEKAHQDELDRLAKEAEDAEMRKNAEEAEVHFAAAASDAIPMQSAPTREGYEIKVLHAQAWLQLFQLWYQNEGKNTPLEKFDAKKLESIRKFCEKHAHKTGERIDSKFIQYREIYKAIATA